MVVPTKKCILVTEIWT